jgi:hypothetical protein
MTQAEVIQQLVEVVEAQRQHVAWLATRINSSEEVGIERDRLFHMLRELHHLLAPRATYYPYYTSGYSQVVPGTVISSQPTDVTYTTAAPSYGDAHI